VPGSQAPAATCGHAGEGGSVNYAELLREIIARLVAARESGDLWERDQILADLELDVLAALEWREAA